MIPQALRVICYIRYWFENSSVTGISEPIFYGDLVNKLKNIVGNSNLSDQFKKIIIRKNKAGYNLDIMRQSTCLVVNQSQFIAMVSFLIAGWLGLRLNDGSDVKL